MMNILPIFSRPAADGRAVFSKSLPQSVLASEGRRGGGRGRSRRRGGEQIVQAPAEDRCDVFELRV
jgi:hypothetical protein